MAGIKALRKIQIGQETTKGTAVAATALWRGEGVLVDNREVVHPAEDVGIITGTDRAYVPKYEGGISLDQTPATFEQLPYILMAAIKTVSGVADGAGSGYIYTYTIPTSSVNDIKTLTLETGDDQQAEEMAYCFVTDFTLSGNAGEAVTMQANLIGRNVAPTTFTGSLSTSTVEEILFGKAKLYIDGVSTYPATTQLTSTFLSFELSYTSGWQPVYSGDGNLYFTFAKQTAPEITLTIKFEHDTNSVAEKAAFVAGTPRSVHISIDGDALGTPGTTYTYKTLAIDLLGKYTTFSGLDEEDGNDVVTGTITARYDSTAASAGQIIVVNELSAIP